MSQSQSDIVQLVPLHSLTVTCHLLSKLYFNLQRIQLSAFLVIPSSTIIRGFALQSLIVRLLYQPFEDVIRLLARK